MARTYAAALTPLRDGGAGLDEHAFAPYVDFLHRGGVVGMLAIGTTGEGILLGGDERMRAAELFMDGPLEVIVNCGAQTTLATAELAGASGYAVPPSVIERLREHVPNLVGLKVSDTPWDAFQPYLLEGLDVLVGPESLIAQGLDNGAAGAVSALASALPEKVVA